MIPKDLIVRAVRLILMGIGVFQIITSLIAFIFLMMTGHWSDHISQIVAIAVPLTLPLTYLVWKRYFAEKLAP